MRDEYDRNDRDDRRSHRHACRRYNDDRTRTSSGKDVSVLGIIALIKGIGALLLSMIPCFGVFGIFAGGLALLLAIASVLIAKQARHGMGIPIAATVVSSTAVLFSVMWLAVAGAFINRADNRTAERQPPQAVPAPPRVIEPQVIPNRNKINPAPNKDEDERVQKQLLEDLKQDRIKEAIRNGPGLPVTAEKLEQDYRTNVVGGDTKYKDQVLEVTGKFVRVFQEKGKPHYTLELDAGADGKTIDCDFREQAKHPLASLERGQQVTVRGLCTGRVNESVKLKDCVLVK